MEFLTELWIPILVSGVALFFASFVSWTMAPHHKTDWKRAPNEDELLKAIRGLNLGPGNYLFPFATHTNSKEESAKIKEKYKVGPRGILALWNLPNMGANLACTVVFFLATAAVIAYVSFAALGGGQSFLKVFQVVGTIGILTYSAAGIPNAIWFKRRMLTDIFDGVVYGMIIGLIFANFWPRA
jgi:hypothetical protein